MQKVEFNDTGLGRQECSWISNYKLVETTGSGCQGNRAFLCERPSMHLGNSDWVIDANCVLHFIYDLERDLVPPSRINDFRLTQNQNDSDIISFTWTAPGDDGTIGTGKYSVTNSLEVTGESR